MKNNLTSTALTNDTPKPQSQVITSLDAFKEALERSSVPVELHARYLVAAGERYAWKMGYAENWQGYEYLLEECDKYLQLKGECAWVSETGERVYCLYAAHDRVAEIFYGMHVGEFEQRFARVSQHTNNLDDALKHVKRPTKRMQNAVLDVFSEYLQH